MANRKYECPCCGFYTFENEPKGDYDICPVCFWEDDPFAYDDPNEVFSCNGVSLIKAKLNYQTFGACRKDLLVYVRKPYEAEISQ